MLFIVNLCVCDVSILKKPWLFDWNLLLSHWLLNSILYALPYPKLPSWRKWEMNLPFHHRIWCICLGYCFVQCLGFEEISVATHPCRRDSLLLPPDSQYALPVSPGLLCSLSTRLLDPHDFDHISLTWFSLNASRVQVLQLTYWPTPSLCPSADIPYDATYQTQLTQDDLMLLYEADISLEKGEIFIILLWQLCDKYVVEFCWMTLGICTICVCVYI